MKPGIIIYSVVAVFIAGVFPSTSTSQDAPSAELDGPDPGDLVERISDKPSRSDLPQDLASTGPTESPSDQSEESMAAPSAPENPNAQAGPSSQLERMSMILTKIRDNERVVDPFGLPMDPGGLPSGSILADQYEEIVEKTEVSATSLASALQQLSLTGAYPGDQKIVVGPRAFKRGEEFGMRFGELTLRIRFEGIEKAKVYFRDMDTKELAFLDFSPRPQEFEPMFKNSRLTTPEGIDSMDNLFIVN